MLVYALAAFGPRGLGIEKADDAVGVADGRDFRIGHHDRLVGEAHREQRAALDARRTVAKHPIEAVPQLADDSLDALVSESVLVAGLRGRKQVQRVDPLVADQRLRQLGVPLGDVDEVIDDPPLCAQHEVEVSQPDVEIDDADALAGLCERRADRRGRGGLAHPAFSGCDYDHFAHAFVLMGSIQDLQFEFVSIQTDLEAPTLDFGLHLFGRDVDAADAQEFGPRLLAEDSRRG